MARLDLVAVVVVEVGQAGHEGVVGQLDAQFLVDAGLGLEVAVAHQIAGATTAPAADAAAVQQVVGVELVQVGRLVGPGHAGLQGDFTREAVRQVQRGAPVVAGLAVVVEAHARRQDGLGRELDVVLDEDRVDLGADLAAAARAGQSGNGPAFSRGLRHRVRVVKALVHALQAQRDHVVKATPLARLVVFAVQGGALEVGGAEVSGREQPFGTAGQALVHPLVAGDLVLHVGRGRGTAFIPASVRQRIVAAVDPVGLVAQRFLHATRGGGQLAIGQRGVVVGVLRVARVDVALATEAGVQVHTMLRVGLEAQPGIQVTVAHALAAGREGAGKGAGPGGGMVAVDVPGVRLGLGDVAGQPETQHLGQGGAQAEAGAA